MKLLVVITFVLVFHIAPFAIATTTRKQLLPPFVRKKQVGQCSKLTQTTTVLVMYQRKDVLHRTILPTLSSTLLYCAVRFPSPARILDRSASRIDHMF